MSTNLPKIPGGKTEKHIYFRRTLMSQFHVTRSGRIALAGLAIIGSLSILGLPQTSFADNTAAPAATAPAAAPAAPAAPAKPAVAKKKVAAKKKVVAKKKVAAKKKGHHGPVFVGVVTAVNRDSSPMTIVASRSLGKKGGDIVFGGDITSHTMVMKGRKHISAKDIKSGEKVVIHYKASMGTLVVTGVSVR
jgi:hypothetical protein